MHNPLSEKLLDEEVFWRDRYDTFAQKGYILRPRYHPNWQPSWKPHPDKFSMSFEDSMFQWKGNLLDAKRKIDGRDVFLKRVNLKTHPHEAKIAWHLGSPESQQESKNRCVPILDVFSFDEEPIYQYIVMPVFRPFDEPNFTTVGEVIDFVNQTLEGLVYMHSKNVAHRDCAAENILMDGSNIYKDGWHPMHSYRARDGGSLPFGRMRSAVEIKYYFIDFGLSTHFDPDQHQRLVLGYLGRVLAPEQVTGIPYDPFKYDVYVLGTVYKTKIVNVFKGLDVLGSMVQLMTKLNPKDRPSATETETLWDSLHQLLPPRWTRLRTIEEEGSIERIVNNGLDVVGMVRESIGL